MKDQSEGMQTKEQKQHAPGVDPMGILGEVLRAEIEEGLKRGLAEKTGLVFVDGAKLRQIARDLQGPCLAGCGEMGSCRRCLARFRHGRRLETLAGGL